MNLFKGYFCHFVIFTIVLSVGIYTLTQKDDIPYIDHEIELKQLDIDNTLELITIEETKLTNNQRNILLLEKIIEKTKVTNYESFYNIRSNF